MRVLPIVRPVDQVAMDYDRIIAFVNSHDETTKGQIQHAHKITEARGTILYVFDIEKKQWCTTDTTEPTLYPRTMTLVTILDNTDDRIDMSIEAIGFLFRCRIRDSLSVLRFEKQKIEMPSMVIDVSTCRYAMEETLRREAFFLLGPRLQFATAGTAVGTIEGKPFSPSTSAKYFWNNISSSIHSRKKKSKTAGEKLSYSFYPFDLKLCRMVQISIAHVFLVLLF